MFKFYGSLSEKTIKDSDKKNKKNISILFAIIDIFAIIISFIIFFVNSLYFGEILSLSIILIIVTTIILLSKPKSIFFRLPITITFDVNSQIINKQIEGINKKPYTIKFSKIKYIYDYGEWYYITFTFDITNHIVCQKDLLVVGNIKDFEEIFKNKIMKVKNR